MRVFSRRLKVKHFAGCYCLFALFGGLDTRLDSRQALTREVVVFEKNDDLWLMDPSDRSVQRWTEGGIANYTFSRSGRVAYDRFSAYQPEFRDLNIYFSEGPGTKPQKLTGDNQSIRPAISPDGTKILYQKILYPRLKWKEGEEAIGKGKGLWLYDIEKKTHRQVAGVIDIPSQVLAERRRQPAYWPGKMDSKNRVWDGVIWSGDSKKFLLVRTFQHGGAITYWVDLERDVPKTSFLVEADLTAMTLGNTEAYFKDYKNDSLVAIQLESGIRRRLAQGLQVQSAWISPDGHRLACLRTDQRHPAFWIVSASGENWQELTGADFDLDGDNIGLQWSQDGSTMVTTTGSEDGSLAWLIDVKTGKRQALGAPISVPEFTTIPRSGAPS